jgi:hypothetical protein
MAYKAVRHVQTTGHGRERTESLAGRRSLARPLLCQSERAAVSGEAERIDPDSRRAGRWAITHPCLPLQDSPHTRGESDLHSTHRPTPSARAVQDAPRPTESAVRLGCRFRTPSMCSSTEAART